MFEPEKSIVQKYLEIHMEPENDVSQKESHLPGFHFQVPAVSFQECM